ncbi:MAG TPA: MBL fold metallo-hydrolase [Roseiarcus sp.]|nr:MBL fold metallo-hydrolase [Roseiarcus sp.]
MSVATGRKSETARGSSGLTHPYAAPPSPGEAIEIASGVLWARLPLPFRLDHINLYFLDDGDGWAVIDAGIASQPARDAWDALLAGPLSGRRLTRLVVTHAHPDHIGLAGWLTERFGVPLLASQTAYLDCLSLSLDPGRLEAKVYTDFYRRNGLDDETNKLLSTLGHGYLKMITPLPSTFQRLVAGERLRIGGRDFAVLSGDGHAPEQIMLYDGPSRLLLVADQVLAKISPNVSVSPVDPNGDPLGLYLRSLAALSRDIADDALVLPGHGLPFFGLKERIDQLIAHHDARCRALLDACRAGPRAPAELLGVIFSRDLDPHQMGFAFNELLAHLNFMLREGTLKFAPPLGKATRVAAM